jgi:hypothetical protein
MSEPGFTEFKNFQNNSGNPENSGQICTNSGANFAKAVFPGFGEVNKSGERKK